MNLPKIKLTFLSNIGISEEKDYFTENLSMLLASGMPISTAISAIEEELRSKRMREIVDALRGDIDAGLPIWKALARADIMAPQVISLVRIGEESGKLPENLKLIVNQQRKERVFRSKIRSAMIYPIIILSLTIIIGTGIAWFILPHLAEVFSQLKIQLPFITKLLLGAGTFVGKYGSIVIPAFLVLLALSIYFIFIFSRTKVIGEYLIFSFPGFKKLIREIELARMGYLLDNLLGAGIPIVEAIVSLGRATTFIFYRRFYDFIKDKVEEGNSLQKAFAFYSKSRKMIPMPMQQLIISGELSGNLSEVLIRMGENFEEKTEITMKNLTLVLEPILLIIVWLGVVGLSLAIILPIYSLVGGLNK